MRLKVCHQIAAWRVMRFLIRTFCRTPNLPHNSRTSRNAPQLPAALCVLVPLNCRLCQFFFASSPSASTSSCAMQLFSFAWSVLGFDLPLKLSANFCNAPFTMIFFCFCFPLVAFATFVFYRAQSIRTSCLPFFFYFKFRTWNVAYFAARCRKT